MQFVDVVIPTYERYDLTYEAVKSVLDQTYKHLQIYIIEDGSNVCCELKKEFQQDERIHYFALGRNRGTSYARNFGAKKGKNPLLAFLDSDDLWLPDKLEKQIQYFKDNPEYKWLHTNEAWFRNGAPVKQKSMHRKQGGKFLEKLFQRCIISASSVLFRREFFETSGYFLPHLRIGEDYELWLRLNYLEPVGFLEENLTIKRAGEWDQLSAITEIDRYRVLALHRFYKKHENEKGFLPFKESCRNEIIHKIEILLKGANKHNNTSRIKQYQDWLRLFAI
ncbi:MAG: glycosyltransferase family 2 protein [Leptospirales bacterium]